MANWLTGTLKSADMIAFEVKRLVFDLPGATPHQAGQHYDIRLTAPNGYQAERSYSLANPPEEKGVVELGVQLLKDGEVSPYLFHIAPGVKVEMRGPIGGHFVWNSTKQEPLLLIGGGSGMVPLMSMLRHYLNQKKDSLRNVVFLISARTIEHILYREELEKIGKENPEVRIIITLTDKQPAEWLGYTERINKEILKTTLENFDNKAPLTYVCGPTSFVESVANNLIELGQKPELIRTERFGGV